MINGFKAFITRGNVVDLAVAVVIGGAFTLVITAVVDGFINPLIAAIFGEPNLDNVANFTINNAQFSIGIILTALLNFLLVAAAIFFVIVLPINRYNERRAAEEEEEVAEAEDVVLLREIRDELRANSNAERNVSSPSSTSNGH